MESNCMKKIFCLLGGLFIALISNAQEDLWSTPLTAPQVCSPQVAEMLRFDKTVSCLNSGKVDLSIPVIDFQDPDFDLDMSLSYNSGGFKPSEPDNFVGRDWSLVTGGVIYREVKGIPDDIAVENGDMQSHPLLKGFLFHSGLNTSNENFISTLEKQPEKLLWRTIDGKSTLFASDYYSFPSFAGTGVEASSDIYHYRFGKYSGQFIINFDRSVSVLAHNGGHISVDLSDYHADMDTGYRYSVLKITTDDGYVYCFGGTYAAMEYTALSWENVFGQSNVQASNSISSSAFLQDRTPEVSAFCLSRIVAPNGRELIVRYVDRVPSEYHDDPKALILSPFRYEELLKYRINECYQLSASPIARAPKREADRSYTLTKIALIESIETDDKIVKFYYSYPGMNELFPLAEAGKFGLSCRTRLDSLSLFAADSSLVESCRLTYFQNHKYSFLSEVFHSRLGKYSFEYSSVELPNPLTINVDYWKYWRGNEVNEYLMPELEHIWPTNDICVITKDREPTGKQYEAGLLQAVYFPTGGKAGFEYEPHTYGSYVDRQNGCNYQPDLCLMSKDEMAGGARIKKISLYDGKALVKETRYLYWQDRNQKKSSGILMYKPHYGVPRHSKVLGEEDSYITTFKYFSEGFNIVDRTSEHIAYSTVIECESGQYTKWDSVFYLCVAPLDGLRKRQFQLNVGCLEEKEKGATYTIRGYSGTEIIISRGGRVFKEYCFDDESSNKDITFDLSELPIGNYHVQLKAEPMKYVGIRVNYPEVIEITGACKITHFTDYASHPDVPREITFANNSMLESFVIKVLDEQYVRNYQTDPIRYAYARGKILTEYDYNSSGRLVKTVRNKYDFSNSDFATYVMQSASYVGTQFGVYYQIARMPLGACVLTEQTISEWDGNTQLETSQTNTYDAMGYLKETKTTTSEGGINIKKYLYAFEQTDDEVYEEMRKRNMYGYVISESVSTFTPEGMERDREAVFRMFSLSSNKQGEANIPVVSSIYCSTGSLTPELRREYLRYDGYGNPVYLCNDRSRHTVYIWGYRGKHLIAQIDNATYEEVKQALGNILPESFSLQEAPDMTSIDNLRSSLSEAHVSTYIYTPLIGMISATTPDGRTTYYEYDAAGRLQEQYLLEGGERKILEHTEYHYVRF